MSWPEETHGFDPGDAVPVSALDLRQDVCIAPVHPYFICPRCGGHVAHYGRLNTLTIENAWAVHCNHCDSVFAGWITRGLELCSVRLPDTRTAPAQHSQQQEEE